MSFSRTFPEWIFNTYTHDLNLSSLEGSHVYTSFINQTSIECFGLSGARRIQNFHIIKFGYPLRRSGYLCATFIIHFNRQQTHYAYLYWPDRGRSCPEPEYVCLSPTFDSRDGEYRHRFLWYQHFIQGYQNNQNLLSDVEKVILDLMTHNVVSIKTKVYTSTRTQRSHIIKFIKDRRLCLKLLCAVISIDAPRIHDNLFPFHTSKNYISILSQLAQDGKNWNIWSPAARYQLAVFITGFEKQPCRTQCGQKLVPLTMQEALHESDINYAPWREIWICQRATDLVINGIAPMFPIFNNWTYLYGIDGGLFENSSTQKRFKLSTLARTEINRLEDDYSTTLDSINIYQIMNDVKNYKLQLILDSKALCITSEYVGQTLASLPALIRQAGTLSPAYLRIYSDATMQARYMFDLCYGVHMLHTRLGTIHSDLHLNNATMFELDNRYKGVPSTEGIQYFSTTSCPVIAYVAGPRGEKDTYIFPHDGWFACIVDFSQSIVGLESRSYTSQTLYKTQIIKAVRLLGSYLPNLSEKQTELIKQKSQENTEALFHILTAIDFLAIGRNYKKLLEDTAATPPGATKIDVHEAGIHLAAKVEQLAIDHLMCIIDWLNGSLTFPFAGDCIIPKVFASYSFASWRPVLNKNTLVNIYNGNNVIKYRSDAYNTFPKWARFDELEQHLDGRPLSQVTGDRGTKPFLNTIDNLEID